MALATTIAKNTIIQTIGKAISIALGWMIVLVMTNYFGAAGFGAYTIMTTYLQFFGVAIDLGFVLVSSQLLAEAGADREHVFANLFTFRLVVSVIILALAPLVIWAFPYSALVKQGVVILTLSFLMVSLLQVFTGLFQKELTIGRALAGELMGRCILFIVVLVAAWQGKSLLFIVGGVVLSSLANLTLVWILGRRFVRVHLAYDPVMWRIIWHRAWPIAAGIVFNLVYFKADTLILSLTRSETEVGVYGAMYRVLEVLITFPTMFAGLLLPILSLDWRHGDIIAFKRLLQQAFDVVLYLAWPLVVGAAFTASRIAAIFGKDFQGAGLILWLLVLATGVIFVGTYLGHVMVATGKQRSMIRVYAASAALGLAGYLLFIPRYGALAAAVMTVVAEMFMALAALVLVRRWLNIAVSFDKFFVALIASFPMALFLWFGQSLNLAVLLCGSTIIYGAMLYYLGAISKEFIVSLFASGPPPVVEGEPTILLSH